MANSVQVEILKRDVKLFNSIRSTYNKDQKGKLIEIGDFKVDISNVDFFNIDLYKADLTNTDLQGAMLSEADLRYANLSNSNLSGAMLNNARFYNTILEGTDLTCAYLADADFRNATLINADLSGAIMWNSSIIQSNLKGAILNDCHIYGSSIWNIITDEHTRQNNIVITKTDESTITVDNIEVAQFIYLLLDNQKIREIINTITSRVVLILGRFSQKRKPVLDLLRKELRKYNYTPVMFDFDKPNDRNFIETVSTLAHMAKFVIADFTDPKIVLQEAEHIVNNIAIPFAPILLKDSDFEPLTLFDLRKGRTTILNTFLYTDENDLLHSLYECVIKPAELLAKQLNEPNPLNSR